jgi:Flp pilus assembly protein TadG
MPRHDGVGKPAGVLRLRREDGQGLVEFALIAPLVVLAFFALASVGILVSHHLKLTDAVAVGGRAAATRTDTADACDAAKTAMQQTWNNDTDWTTNVEASCASATIDGDPGITITIKYPCSINLVAHSFTCPNGQSLQASVTERLG